MDSPARPTERLTVMQLLPALDGGGVERGTLEVAKALVAAGHRSIVASAGGRMVPALVACGSEHVVLPVGAKWLPALASVRALRRLLVEQRVDIAHARSRLPAWITWHALRGIAPAQRPHFVTTVHGFYSVSRYSAVMTRGTRVIAVSKSIRDYVLAEYPGVDPARVSLIPRGIDPAEFHPRYRPSSAWRAKWNAAYPKLQNRRVICLPGRITRRKGHEDLLSALARLRRGGHDVHALVVGGTAPRHRAYLNELQASMRRARVEDAVTFTGARNDIREIYTVSDIVLSLSHKPESFGRTVLEALSLGVPVIGYAHGGVAEILENMFPEGAVTPGDIEGLAERIARFLEHPPVVEARNAYPLDAMLRDTLSLYGGLPAHR